MIASILILAFAGLQRLAELAIARRNTRRLLARGAVESGAGHYPIIVGLHAAWFVGLCWLAWDRPPNLPLLGLYLAVVGLRVWTMASLGARWSTRILVLPGAPRVRRGPYRWIRHPNYLVVAFEVALLPLVFGLVTYAVVFSALNASALWVRIRAEEAALNAAERD